MSSDFKHPAVVLGMFETGLGVARSLGQSGIIVYGFDYKKDIAFYSRYVKASICPHPLQQETDFISYIISFGRGTKVKPVIFITSDEFLTSVSRNREQLRPYFIFSLPEEKLLAEISDKFQQYKLAERGGTLLPKTYILETINQADRLSNSLSFPVLIKALDVNLWRRKISSSLKAFVAPTAETFYNQSVHLLECGVKIIVQEIVKGPDTNHFKYCAFYLPDGKSLCEFTLRKIRQNPVHFGVGAVVESIEYDDLMKAGRNLFRSIGYSGVGSAEFKLDERDGCLKLIEINPRYWQQNYLPTACGMNFALIDYLATTGLNPEPVLKFKTGIKWVNRYLDFDSFLVYRKEKVLNFRQWRNSLRGKKIYSDFCWDDILPAGYEFRFGLKILKIPGYLLRRFYR